MAKSSVFKARLKVVIVLVDRQLYGSEFHTEGELRLKDFADIARDIRGTDYSSNALVSINAVAPHRARLVLGWVTAFG